MSVCVKDLFKLQSFKDGQVVAGEDGLEKPIRWVYLAETFPNVKDIFEWLSGQELLFVIGYGIKNGAYSFDYLVEMASQRAVSGMVVFLGDYIQEIPEHIKIKCDACGLPLLTLPWNIKYVDVTREITQDIIRIESDQKSSFDILDALLFSTSLSVKNMMKRGALFNIDFSQKHRIMVTDIDAFDQYISHNRIDDEPQVHRIKHALYGAVQFVLLENAVHTVHMKKSDSVISLLKEVDYQKLDFKSINAQITDLLSKSYKGLSVSIGIGSAYDDIHMLRTSYTEAEKVLEVKLAGLVSATTYIYEHLHFYKLLIEIDASSNVKRQFPYLLNPILEYDKQHKTELVRTLELYLNTGKSLSETAKIMYIHRNTVKYRVDKIKQLTNLDLGDMEVCFNFMFELRMARYYNLLSLDESI